MPIPASISEDLNTLWTATWQLMRPEAVDQIFNEYPFFFWLNSKGRKRTKVVEGILEYHFSMLRTPHLRRLL